MRMLLHMALHVLVPVALARAVGADGFKKRATQALCGMLIDIDHLLANPIFDPNRCSVGFHPLHTDVAALGFCILALIPATRWFGIGLGIHLILDSIDCFFMLQC